ncbi:MAG: saccharopine dehydrogenase NADP-binding domain-containing protein [Saprospiraceae bacterium]|nr:saccharopine dehydrogenase NADP-binding domain-containing protein [Saprospiraceae bacterium]
MKSILILGAGRSATTLIDYLIAHSKVFDWHVRVADIDLELAKRKIRDSKSATAIALNINNERQRQDLIAQSDVVVSMLPPHMHLIIAQDCLRFGCHLLTASYLSKEMEELHQMAKSRNLLFLNEMGLDPGIDHMSAMAIKARILEMGGQISSFQSYTGGLIDRASDSNPWHYKISWNPRNVVLAGRDTASFREEGKVKFLSYHQLFEQFTVIEILGGEKFEMYPNRDSLKYLDTYGLQDAETLIRGTLRHMGFCKGWSVLVKLGLTDPYLTIKPGTFGTYAELLSAFLPKTEENMSEHTRICLGINDPVVCNQLEWLFDNTPLPPQEATAADLLQMLLVEKWNLHPDDLDLVVMHHEFEYSVGPASFRLRSTLRQKGRSSIDTAMTKLVGLPLAIATKLLLNNVLTVRGVQIPVLPAIFQPVLDELELEGVKFEEEITPC